MMNFLPCTDKRLKTIRETAVTFTRQYFKFGCNTNGLSRSHLKKFSAFRITVEMSRIEGNYDCCVSVKFIMPGVFSCRKREP